MESVISTPAIAIDTEAEESMLDNREAEEVAPKVVKVLAEVPKSPRMSRPKPTPTKDSVKDKKGKQPTIPVRTSPRRNPPKPTAQDEVKSINLESKEE